MHSLPDIYTKRLHLRQLRVEDLSSLVQHANNKTISENIANIPYPYTQLDASLRLGYILKGFKSGTHFCFAIELLESKELIGEISLHLIDPKLGVAQLAYWIGEDFWGKGIVTEAVKPILGFGFKDAKFTTIYADCKLENKASESVMIKNNMTKFKSTRHQVFYKITEQDTRL